MQSSKTLALCLLLVLAGLATIQITEARYLPTRGKMDRLDKLRELLKELLETEIEKEEYQGGDAPPRWHPEQKLFYKREVTKHT